MDTKRSFGIVDFVSTYHEGPMSVVGTRHTTSVGTRTAEAAGAARAVMAPIRRC